MLRYCPQSGILIDHSVENYAYEAFIDTMISVVYASDGKGTTSKAYLEHSFAKYLLTYDSRVLSFTASSDGMFCLPRQFTRNVSGKEEFFWTTQGNRVMNLCLLR